MFVWRGNNGDRRSGQRLAESQQSTVDSQEPRLVDPSRSLRVNQGDPPPCARQDIAGKRVKRGARKC